MPRRFRREKDWSKYPLREAARRFYDCALCPLKITVGENYYDAGNGVRVHRACGDACQKDDDRG